MQVAERNMQVQNEEKIKQLVEQIVESVSSVGYPGEIERLKEKYTKLKTVHQLQKSIVRQNMHNAMSPLSAISGYLELINISLLTNPDLDQIEYYRKKIETGINEVNTIIEQLQGIYNDESDNLLIDDVEHLLDVDLNWLVREVCNKMHFTDTDIKFNMKSTSLHVQTDIFITKLIIFNLINYAIKCNCKKEQIELITDSSSTYATFEVKFEVVDSKKIEIAHVIKKANSINEDYESENSFDEGLLTSVKLAKEIKGEINYLSLQQGKAHVKLSLPKS
jgi:signal transduction histidine kinase